MRETVHRMRREKEAAIKIQRSVSPMKLRRKKELEAQRTEKLSTRLSVEQWEQCVEAELADAVLAIAKEIAEEERRVLEEQNRMQEEIAMGVEDVYMNRFVECCRLLCENVIQQAFDEYLDNEVIITYHVAKTQIYDENELAIRARESTAMTNEETEMRAYLIAKELHDNAKLYAFCDQLVDMIQESWIEFEIDRLYHAFLPETVTRHIERLEESARLAALVAKKARDETIAGVVRLATAQAMRKATDTLVAKRVKEEAADNAIALASSKSPSAASKKGGDMAAMSGKPKAVTASAKAPLQQSAKRSSSKPQENAVAVKSQKAAPPPATVSVKSNADVVHEVAESLVRSILGPSIPSMNAMPDSENIASDSDRNNEIVGSNLVDEVVDEVPFVDEEPREDDNKVEKDEMIDTAIDDLIPSTVDMDNEITANAAADNFVPLTSATATNAAHDLNKMSADIEAMIYGAEYSKALSLADDMRSFVLTCQESKLLDNISYEYYLQFTNLLTAECLIDIADYREAGLLLELVMASTEFMGPDSVKIVSEATLFAGVVKSGVDGSVEAVEAAAAAAAMAAAAAVAADDLASVSSLGGGGDGKSVVVDIDAERKSRVWIALASIARVMAAYDAIESYMERVSCLFALFSDFFALF